MRKINIKQVWVYEFKPTDTMRVLHAFMSAWRLYGDDSELQRKGDKLYAIRTHKDS